MATNDSTFTSKTRQQIANEYGIHRNTLNRRLKKVNLNLPKGILLPAHVKAIYKALGNPPFLKEKNALSGHLDK